MREILFRGKNSITNVWHTGFYVHVHKTTHCALGYGDSDKDNDIHKIIFERMTDWELPNQHFAADVDPDTVGQYTGLKDKNGVKIFEGDIVRYIYGPGKGYWNANQLSVIKIDEFGVRMDGIKGTNKYALLGGWLSSIPYGAELFEVVGNIYDNPELLKEVVDNEGNSVQRKNS